MAFRHVEKPYKPIENEDFWEARNPNPHFWHPKPAEPILFSFFLYQWFSFVPIIFCTNTKNETIVRSPHSPPCPWKFPPMQYIYALLLDALGRVPLQSWWEWKPYNRESVSHVCRRGSWFLAVTLPTRPSDGGWSKSDAGTQVHLVVMLNTASSACANKNDNCTSPTKPVPRLQAEQCSACPFHPVPPVYSLWRSQMRDKCDDRIISWPVAQANDTGQITVARRTVHTQTNKFLWHQAWSQRGIPIHFT